MGKSRKRKVDRKMRKPGKVTLTQGGRYVEMSYYLNEDFELANAASVVDTGADYKSTSNKSKSKKFAKSSHVYHEDPVKLEFGKGAIYASSGRTIVTNVDLLLSLTGTLKEAKYGKATAGALEVCPPLVALCRDVPSAAIEWRDGQAPDLPPGFVGALAKWIAEGHTIWLGCTAGHGRTGVFLCLLFGALWGDSDGVDLETVLAYVRANYCTDAVETEAQVSYLRRLGLCSKKDKGSNGKGGYISMGSGYAALNF